MANKYDPVDGTHPETGPPIANISGEGPGGLSSFDPEELEARVERAFSKTNLGREHEQKMLGIKPVAPRSLWQAARVLLPNPIDVDILIGRTEARASKELDHDPNFDPVKFFSGIESDLRDQIDLQEQREQARRAEKEARQAKKARAQRTDWLRNAMWAVLLGLILAVATCMLEKFPFGLPF